MRSPEMLRDTNFYVFSSGPRSVWHCMWNLDAGALGRFQNQTPQALELHQQQQQQQ